MVAISLFETGVLIFMVLTTEFLGPEGIQKNQTFVSSSSNLEAFLVTVFLFIVPAIPQISLGYCLMNDNSKKSNVVFLSTIMLSIGLVFGMFNYQMQ